MDKKHDQDRSTSDREGMDIKPGDYLRSVRSHLRNNREKDAYTLLLQATIRFPEDPVILSYFGCMQAVVGKKFRSGIEICRRAVHLLKQQQTFSEELLYPVFYLNLGRAYVAASKKKDAIESFKKGLQYDKGNSDLKKELQLLGVRKQPLVSFLDRSNPINKCIGFILHKTKRSSAGKTGTRGR